MKLPTMPKLSMEKLKEKLPQPRREFVLYDSEHPEDGTDMEYHPSTGYPAPPVENRAQPASSIQENGYDPFQRNTVYPGGQARVPYAAGGAARTVQPGGVWPPEPTYSGYTAQQTAAPPVREQPPRQNYAPAYGYVQPEYETYQVYKPQARYAQPGYAQPPRYDGYPAAARTQAARPQPQPKQQPGLGVRVAAVIGALLPKREPRRPARPESSRPQAQPQAPYAPYQQSYQQPYQAQSAPPARQSLRPGELKYYIWSGSIVAGLALTVISFIYACAA